MTEFGLSLATSIKSFKTDDFFLFYGIPYAIRSNQINGFN